MKTIIIDKKFIEAIQYLKQLRKRFNILMIKKNG